MVTFETNMRISEMQKSIDKVIEGIDHLMEIYKPEEDLWDNSDIIRRWKVSERTLADWRAVGKIGFVQIEKKIYYTKNDRDRFIEKYHVNNKRSEF